MSRPLFALLLLAITIGLRSSILPWPAIEEDEAQHIAAAVELAHGGAPYLSVVDGKTPLLWYMFAAVMKVAGPFNTIAIRLFTDGFVWAAGLLLWYLGILLHSSRAGRWTALLFVCFSTCSSYKILASNFELHLLPFDILAYVCLALGFLRCRPWWLLLSGAAIATAFFVKQTAGITLVTQTGFCLLVAWTTPWRRLAYSSLGCLLGGFGVALAGYIAWMTAIGLADQLRFWTWDYAWYMTSLTSAKLPFWPRFTARVGLWIAGTLVVHAWAICWLLHTWRPRQQWRQAATAMVGPLRSIILFWLVLEWFPICLGGRFPPHYFLMYLPPLALLAGFWIADRASIETYFATRCRGRRWAERLLLFALPVFGCCIVNWNIPWSNRVYGLHRADHAKLARRIQRETGPNDRIFVWGDNPEFYVFARRRSATRFLWVDYLVGRFSIPSSLIRDPTRYDQMVLPGTWDLLFADFVAHPPRLIIDTSPADLHDFKIFPMARYQRLADYVAKYYRLGWIEDEVHFYLRIEKY